MDNETEINLRNRLNNLASRYETLHHNYSELISFWNQTNKHNSELRNKLLEQSKLIDTLNERIKMLEGN